jgi:glycosyltransferase involved in cell wall biosynthesis
MLVSVCMIVRDEELNLAQAISSIPASYEVIVVDTGSVDRTVEIAMSLGAKVSQYQWDNDFSKARNQSVSLAQGRYILILDADEQLSEDVENKIKDFVFRYPNTAGTVTIHNLIEDEITKHRMVRFFPNSTDFYFEGMVHEKVVFKGQDVKFEDTNVEVIHTGYQLQVYNEKDKAQRYLDLYMKHLELHPRDGYMLYQLGKLYYSIHDLPKAKEALYRCLNVQEASYLYFPAMLVILGYTLQKLGNSQEAESLLKPYISQYPSFPDLAFILGMLAMDTGNITDIESYFLQALKIGETDKYSSVQGVGSFKAMYNLGVYNEVVGNKTKALDYYRGADQLGYKPAIDRLKKINF